MGKEHNPSHDHPQMIFCSKSHEWLSPLWRKSWPLRYSSSIGYTYPSASPIEQASQQHPALLHCQVQTPRPAYPIDRAAPIEQDASTHQQFPSVNNAWSSVPQHIMKKLHISCVSPDVQTTWAYMLHIVSGWFWMMGSMVLYKPSGFSRGSSNGRVVKSVLKKSWIDWCSWWSAMKFTCPWSPKSVEP